MAGAGRVSEVKAVENGIREVGKEQEDVDHVGPSKSVQIIVDLQFSETD